ncbi:hypothetical protein VRU48_12700 [Pedobacter sp. KR3-3]|uniref:Uncharacterized protein n=1 Tax=Pedobacter albus TaxID=3113905 RepID=A0ABU7I928_9SPHI|nr:hypothetical protein [Pedobacter sp. KR3-3]MEE1945972.1 hypothetical protein [Pedobacter sp. KR3-3]
MVKDIGTKTVKSRLKSWHLAIITCLLLIIFGLAAVVLSLDKMTALLLLVALIASYFIATFITRADTTLSISNGFLHIHQHCKPLNITREFEMPLSNIRGFAINEVTRGSRALFIYLNDFDYHKFPLLNFDEEMGLASFLRKLLKEIHSSSNPLFPTFGSAYVFALKRTGIFLLLYLAIALPIFKYAIDHDFSDSDLFFGTIALSLPIWWFIVRQPVKRHYFRFGAFFWFSNFVIYLSVLILIPIKNDAINYFSKPAHLAQPSQLFAKAPSLLYTFDKVSFGPDSVLISDYNEGSNKGLSVPVRHHFVTPLGNGEPIKGNGVYDLWLVQEYKQDIEKSNPEDVQQTQIHEFHQETEKQFIATFSEKPTFYEAGFDNRNIYRLISSSLNYSRRSVILEPHWETLAAYRKELLKDILLAIAGIIGANLLGCLFIAINR